MSCWAGCVWARSQCDILSSVDVGRVSREVVEIRDCVPGCTVVDDEEGRGGGPVEREEYLGPRARRLEVRIDDNNGGPDMIFSQD